MGISIALQFALWTASCGSNQDALGYRLTLPFGSDHAVVTIELPDLAPPRTLVMPRAIPMGYSEVPYADFVSGVRAVGSDGEDIEVLRVEGPRWQLGGAGGERTLASITYDVNLRAMEHQVLDASDSSKVREGYAGLLGYSVFAFIEGLEERPIHLEVRVPESWPVFSTLRPQSPPDKGRTTARARDFYALADAQIALGPLLRVRRIAGKPPLFVAAYTELEWDVELGGQLGRHALDAMVGYFGDAPFPHYTMMVEVLTPVSPEHRYGFSMEHLDSATFFLGPEGALTADTSLLQRRRVLYNYAHHFAHAWIPKRCAGVGYFPFSWEFAPVLDTIWFSEGFGQYAAAVAVTDLMNDGDRFLEQLIDVRFRSSLSEAPDSIRRMSTIELSRVASTRYGSDFRLGRNVFSRGALMAAEMDAHMRAETDGERSLRDALRHLCAWAEEHGRPFRIEDLPPLFKEGTGVDVSAIQARWLAPQ